MLLTDRLELLEGSDQADGRFDWTNDESDQADARLGSEGFISKLPNCLVGMIAGCDCRCVLFNLWFEGQQDTVPSGWTADTEQRWDEILHLLRCSVSIM